MGEEAGPLRQIVASGAGMMDGGVGDLSKDPQDSGDWLGIPKVPQRFSVISLSLSVVLHCL